MKTLRLETAVAGAIIALASSAAFGQVAEPTFKGDPDVYKVIFEDANFRVIESVRKVGVRDKPHSHPTPSIAYNLTDCASKQYFPDGKVTEMQAKAGSVNPIPVIPSHSAENVAATDCKQLFIEKK